MKIKSIYKSLLALPLAALSLASCSDWLEVKPQNIITKDEFWSEKSDVDGMIAGLYSSMESQNVIERMMIWGEFRSDNISSGSNINNNQNLYKIFREDINASNSYTTWDQFYYVINQANTIIDQAPAVAAKDPSFSQGELAADIAECSAVRDLMYFYLIRTFRDVPYTTTPYYDDDQVMDLPATSFDNVLDSLINDLENVKNNAVTRYPASSTTKALYQTGRITRDAIYAMLCEMYLWKQDYQNCIRYADLVIQDKQNQFEDNQSSSIGMTDLSRFNGYPLIAENTMGGTTFGNAYNEIFGKESSSGETGNSSESIFELYFMSDANMPKNGAVNNFYGPTSSGTTGYAAPSSFVKESSSDKTSTGNAYYRRDARFYENIIDGGNTIGKYTYPNLYLDASNASAAPDNTVNQYTNGRVEGNWIIYRLTDIMLLKAEALAAMMSDSTEPTAQDQDYLNQAFSIVNAINKRSILQTDAQLNDTLVASNYTTKTNIVDLVLAERQRELMFEGKRYYDLVRRARRDGNTSILSQNILHKYSSGGATISSKFSKMDYIYWPYYIDEVKVNKNLHQNPAFGSGESESIKRN